MTRSTDVALCLLLSAGLLAGCQREEHTTSSGYHPAEVGEANAEGTRPVTFTADAAEQVDLALVAARASGRLTLVPYAALIYDGQGGSWVYTNPSGRTYQRAKVVIDRVEGEAVYLTGIRAGTKVVTVGATEVYGAELGISGAH